MSFPTIVYKCPGPHACAGSTYSYVGVDSDEALAERSADGWFQTLPEAIAGKADLPEIPADDAAPTREEMAIKAVELGIKFNHKTTDRRLAEMIEYVLEEHAKGV